MHATSFDELGLRPEILRAVTESGYTTPTPIQAQAIPPILAGHDIMGAFRERISARPGEKLKISTGDAIHLFDRETGKRISA